jgi:flavorubredoxin
MSSGTDDVSVDVDAAEILAGRLYQIGTPILLDGRVSWAPASATGYQPVSAYLVLSDEQATIVDTGVARQAGPVLRQLESLIPAGLPVTIFLTRSEYDCIGNVGPLMSRFNIDALYAGGISNPFDAFGEVTLLSSNWSKQVHIDPRRVQPGTSAQLGSSDRFEVVFPVVRILATYWLYDKVTKALFTSDFFSHLTLQDPTGPRIVDAPVQDNHLEDAARDFLLAKFFWLPLARTESIANNLRQIFTEREVDIIAPGHGCVVKGKAAVAQQVDLVCDILSRPLSSGGNR